MGHGRRYIRSLHMGYELSGRAAAIPAVAGKSLMVFDAFLHNRSGSSSDMGVLAGQPASNLNPGTITNASSPNFTAAPGILSGSATTLFTTTNNDGFLIQCAKPFGLVCFTVSQAQTGSPVYAYSYYNGSAYVALTTVAVPDFSSTGDKYLVFAAPRDWVAGTTAAVGGNAAFYSIRALATTAPSQAVKATGLAVGAFLHFQGAVANSSVLGLKYPLEFPYRLDTGEFLMPYFGIASSSNMVTATYMIGE